MTFHIPSSLQLVDSRKIVKFVILIQIKWDLFHFSLEEKSFNMNSSCFFWVLVEISSSVHGFGVVQPMFTKFEQLWLTSRFQIKFKTHPYAHSSFQKDFTTCKFQAISLWPSPPLKPVVGGFSKDLKMSYTHPNSIPSVAMGSRRQEE